MDSNKPKPYKIGDRLIVTPQSTGIKGDGVYKDKEGFIIMIRRAEQGYKYDIEITGVYATYAFARIILEIKDKTATEIIETIEKAEE